MNRSELLKLIVFLACLTLMLSVTSLTGRIALMNGMSDAGVKSALMTSLVVSGAVGMSCMIFLFKRINKNANGRVNKG